MKKKENKQIGLHRIARARVHTHTRSRSKAIADKFQNNKKNRFRMPSFCMWFSYLPRAITESDEKIDR